MEDNTLTTSPTETVFFSKQPTNLPQATLDYSAMLNRWCGVLLSIKNVQKYTTELNNRHLKLNLILKFQFVA